MEYLSSTAPSSVSGIKTQKFELPVEYSIPSTSTSNSTLEASPTPSFTTASTPIPPMLSRDSNDPEFSDESDDEIQDWSLLNNFSKKGMKDFEPLLTNNDKSQLSAYDQNKLNKARNMRFDALAVKRGSIVNLENLKTSTIYVNIHDYDDLFMLQPKGKFLETMGIIDNQNICHFDFEEAVYLVERGSCMLKFWDKEDELKNKIYHEMPPLSLQAVYSILIKNEEQLNQYLVYSILKRDGYIITRNERFNGNTAEIRSQLVKSPNELFKNVQMSWWTKFLSNLSDYFKINFPFKFTFSYFNVFTYLHSKILNQSIPTPKHDNLNNNNRSIKEHKISFNVWKPSPNFKKKNPPFPDYQISIFKATQRLPKYLELKSLLERSYSNPDTHKPKPKIKSKKTKTSNEQDQKNEKKLQVLESGWDYAKGIDITNLKYNPHRITIAIVDNATVNFITLSHCSFVSEGPVWRDHWVTWKPPQKKKKKNYNKNNKDNKNNNTKISRQTKNPKGLTLDGPNESNTNLVPDAKVLPKSAKF